MKTDFRVLTICRQSLKDVKYAVRAYNLYKNLEKLGCKVTYLDGWKPTYSLNLENVKNWIKILLFKRFNKKYTRIFVENVQSYLLAKVMKKIKMPIVLDVRDDLNLHADAMGVEISRKDYLEHELEQIEWFEIAQRILVVSQSMIDYYSEKYDKEFDNKFVVIMNASDPKRFKNSSQPNDYKIGTLGGANQGMGWDLLLDAAKIVKKKVPDLSVHIGYKYIEETKSYIESLQKKYNENWIFFNEDIDYLKNASDFFSSLYLSIVPCLRYKNNEMALGSKIFDSMASARPLVVTNCKEHAKIVKKENCGLVCDLTPEDMAEKILILFKNRQEAYKLGQNGRNAVEQRHNWEQRSKRVFEEVFIRQ